MTDQKNDLCEEDYHGINVGLIFCIICFVLAVLIFLAGGSTAFALIFGVISVLGIYFFWTLPKSDPSARQPDGSVQIGPSSVEVHFDPAYRSLSTNVHNPDRNPSFEWEDRND